MKTRPTYPKIFLVASVFSLLSYVVALPALADPIKVAGKQAFNVPFGTGSITASQRTVTIQKNIENALVAASDRSPTSVSITYVNKQPVLTLGGFYVASIDDATAKRMGLTPAALAQQWSQGLKSALVNQAAVNNYIAQLTGTGRAPDVGTTSNESGSFTFYRHGSVIYIPSGMTMPIVLSTSLSSEFARSGDPIQATLSQPLVLGESEIPANSLLLGQVTESVPGARMSHSGQLGVKFNTLQLPNGSRVPINAHIIGGLGKYEEVGGASSDQFHGESTKHKIEDAAVRGAVGVGGGALLGTVVGAIASHGYGTGRGALAGATIGGAIGVADSLLLRKGGNVRVESGQSLTLQLDAPAQLAAN
jgi:hypothetical protein